MTEVDEFADMPVPQMQAIRRARGDKVCAKCGGSGFSDEDTVSVYCGGRTDLKAGLFWPCHSGFEGEEEEF